METISAFSTNIEYEQWLGDNREQVLDYVKANEVVIRELPLSARAFNILRMNNITHMSQLVTQTPYEISQLPQLGKVEADEVLRFRRQYLKTHKNNIVAFVTTQKNNSLSNDEKFATAAEVNTPESKNVDEDHVTLSAEDKSKVRDRAKAKRLLSHPATKAKLVALLQDKNCRIRSMNFSVRAYNGLTGAGITDMLTVIDRYPDGFEQIHALGSKSVKEICHIVEEYVAEHLDEIDFAVKQNVVEADAQLPAQAGAPSQETIHRAAMKILGTPEKRTNIIQTLIAREMPIDTLGLSVRSYNALRRAQIEYVHQALALYPDRFVELRNLGKKSVDEICYALEKTVITIEEELSGYSEDTPESVDDKADGMGLDVSQEEVATDYTLLQLLEHPAFQEKARHCLGEVDVPIESMGFGVRALNALTNAGMITFSAILPVYPDSIGSLKNIGAKTITEIQERVEYYLEKLQPIVAAYCGNDADAMYTDSYITETVLHCFDNIGFNGLSFQQMRAAVPEVVSESRTKKVIGRLLSENKLEYVDFRCYRVYPSVFEVLQISLLSEEDKMILQKRFAGATLEAIAVERGVGRERIRQIVNKKIEKLREYLLNAYGVRFFDEDFYTYLYEHYDAEKELWFNYLSISEKTFGYLVNTYTKGKAKIETALSDPDVNLILKFKIREYLNRNKIMIDGILMDNQRAAIEDYALSKFARDEMSYDEFVDYYNGLLRNNGMAFDEKLYNTDEVRRTRTNRWAESRLCLWKQGERLRFYNIDAQDYTELFETLNLESFQNTEISTLKFFNDYPELMGKYDIRDQYELHNLLKKIVDTKTCHDISFHRQPMICFGEFDRKKAIYEIIEALSPITIEELSEYVHSEYGYDKGTALNTYFQPFASYYHQGVYSVDFKKIPNWRAEILKTNLSEDFYYISEIKQIYTALFAGADEEEINHRSLKCLGYTVLEKYVLRDYSTAEEFFTSVLLREDVFSLDVLNKRYGNIQMYRQTVYSLRNSFDIVQFDDKQYLNFRRLAKLGITKADLQLYIDAVYDYVEENTYFTVPYLKDAFETGLDDLGFGVLFYAGLLAASGKFEHTYCYGMPIFYKGQLSESISTRGFLLEVLSRYDSVDLDDFIADYYDQYGVRIPARHEVTGVLSGTDFYYDNIMGKIYRNKSYYYAEFDE